MDNRPYPKSGRRGCQCADGTYRIDCCDGDSQGVGSLVDNANSLVKTLDGDGNVINTTGSGNFICDLVTFTGFAVAQDGTITVPTINTGTITATSPSSFSTVTENTTRTLLVTITAPSEYANSGESIVCSVTANQPATPPLPDLTCSDVTLTGFAVAINGSITLPTVDIGTISSTSPASFSIVDVATLRTLSVDITVPSGYGNEGNTITCTTTAIQPLTATLACSDITFTGFAVSYDGVITLPTIDIGTISATSPASFSDPEVDTLRTLSVDVTVPSGYYNAGATLACSTTATQPGNQPALACDDITFTGLAVDFKGAITTPSVDIGTVASISPTSFSGHVTTDTSRTITINVTVPSGYSNSGATLACSKTVTQSAVTEFWIRYTADNFGKAAGQALSVSQGCSLQTNNTLVNNKFIHLGSNNIPTMSDEVYIVNGRPGDGTCGYSGGGFGSYFIVHGFATLIGQAATVGEKIACQAGNSPAYLTEPSASYQSADFVLTTSTTSGVTAITECT